MVASTLVFKPQLFTLFIESRNNNLKLLSRIASRTVWPDDKITFSILGHLEHHLKFAK